MGTNASGCLDGEADAFLPVGVLNCRYFNLACRNNLLLFYSKYQYNEVLKRC